MITALEGGEGSASRPGLYLPSGKDPPLYRRLDDMGQEVPEFNKRNIWREKLNLKSE
jgi:hypothetical protein